MLEEIKKGAIKVSETRYANRWTQKERILLFESLKCRYPIGTILLLKRKGEQDRNINFGPFIIEAETSDSDEVLDGFNRLVSIFSCLTNPHSEGLKCDLELWEKEFGICYDLETEEFFFPGNRPLLLQQLHLFRLLDTFELINFFKKLDSSGNPKSKVFQDRAIQLSTDLIDYRVPVMRLYYSVEDAKVIFQRINKQGSRTNSEE
jgi:hypothetical protein